MGGTVVRGEQYGRVAWLIFSRPIIFGFLMATLIVFQLRYHVYPFPVSYFYSFTVFTLLLNGGYWLFLKRFHAFPLFSYLQVGFDILLITVLIYLTGGVDSGFSLLYHLIIISASILLYRRGGYLAAALSSILYGALLDLQYYNVLGLTRSLNFSSLQVLYQVFISIVSFYLVAFLTSYLADRLRTVRLELSRKSADFNDLRVLQDQILRSVGSGIITMDMTGAITSWNPAAEHITGYEFGEIRQHWNEVFGGSIKSLFGHTDDLRERAFQFEGEILKKDGSKALLGYTASLLRDDRDDVRGIILIFQDISKIAEMEEQIRRQDRLATVGSLAAGIAHEIRNPLASLSGSIQMLQSELDIQGDNKRLMSIVLRETDRLNTIITEFLEYARPRRQNPERIDLSLLIAETIVLLKHSKDFGGNIEVRTAVDPSVEISGDPPRLRQVFWNLLINAVQAMPQGGIVTIEAASASSGPGESSWCEVTVSDTGGGIPDEDLRKIFAPFFTTKAGGSGLGLAIAYRIVEDHGGMITVNAEPGHGAKFTIRLPLAGDVAAWPRSASPLKRKD